MDYRNLSDEEIKKTVKDIKNKAKSEQEIKDQIKNILKYPHTVAVTMAKSELSDLKMSMVMMRNKNGEVLHI